MSFKLKLMRLTIIRTAGFCAILACSLLAQRRFADGEFKGFTESPTEHIINRYDGVIETRVFEGSVIDSSGAPMRSAVVEVRGPGTSERIKATMTNKGGNFRIGRLSEGSYIFKITRDGFQSVVGQLKIKPGSGGKAPIRFELRFGV